MRIHDRSICFVNCHFAAHMEAVSRRNEDFDHVFKTMTFATPSSGIMTTSGVCSTFSHYFSVFSNGHSSQMTCKFVVILQSAMSKSYTLLLVLVVLQFLVLLASFFEEQMYGVLMLVHYIFSVDRE